jgi:hypothetical protein
MRARVVDGEQELADLRKRSESDYFFRFVAP